MFRKGDFFLKRIIAPENNTCPTLRLGSMTLASLRPAGYLLISRPVGQNNLCNFWLDVLRGSSSMFRTMRIVSAEAQLGKILSL